MQLTSLRGVACLVVLVGHVIQVVRYGDFSRASPLGFSESIIDGTFNAEGAVLLFFVLSGCVLSLSLLGVKDLDGFTIGAFYIKRIFRLYPLLWFAVIPAMLSVIVARHLATTGIFVDWLARNLNSPVTVARTIFSFAGLYTRYNGPMWSLRVELIYSALFPGIFLIVLKPRLRVWFIGALAVIALLPIPSELGTAFGFSFAAGASIPFSARWNIRHHGYVATAALFILLYDRLALGGLHPEVQIFDIIETISAFFVVREIYLYGLRYRFLASRPFVHVGELSFSIYLLHLPIFLICFTLVTQFFNVAVLLEHSGLTQICFSLLTAVVTIAVSIITYNFVELPLHNYGRSLGKRVLEAKAPRAAEASVAAAGPLR